MAKFMAHLVKGTAPRSNDVNKSVNLTSYQIYAQGNTLKSAMETIANRIMVEIGVRKIDIGFLGFYKVDVYGPTGDDKYALTLSTIGWDYTLANGKGRVFNNKWDW